MILLAAHARPGRTGGPNPGAAVMGAIDQTTFTNNMAKEIMLYAFWLSRTHGRFLTSLD